MKFGLWCIRKLYKKINWFFLSNLAYKNLKLYKNERIKAGEDNRSGLKSQCGKRVHYFNGLVAKQKQRSTNFESFWGFEGFYIEQRENF